MLDLVSAVLGIGRSPAAYQFWFIRDLIVLVVLAPPIYYVARRADWALVAGLSCVWLLGLWPVQVPSPEAVVFFTLGSVVALRGMDAFVLDRYGPAIAWTYVPLVVADALSVHSSVNPYLHRIGLALGVATVLFFSRFLAESPRLKRTFLWLAGSSFFVFAAHEPLLTVMRKVSYRILLPDSSAPVLFLYFALPVAVTAACVVMHRLLMRHAPQFANLITGGRQARIHPALAYSE